MNGRDIVYAGLAAATLPIWARKARGDWRGRRGFADVMAEPPQRGRVLIHAVSVGEVNALRSLVPMLQERGDGPEVVVSVGTDTGIARARSLFEGVVPVVRYPIDFSGCVARFLDAVKPTAVGLVELELWPNFVEACARRGIPVGVINGRLSARSFKGYQRIKRLIGPSFGRLTVAAVQDEAYAERFVAMGVRSNAVVVSGNMKWDAAPSPGRELSAKAVELAQTLGLDPSKPLIVAGSTGPTGGGGEEALLHAACPEGVQLACAPRKPERFDEAAAAMPGCRRRSDGSGDSGSGRFLLDTIGELRALYELADVVVIGRSFGSLHGSDPIEPIALGKPCVMGPAGGDFATIVGTFERAGALVRAEPEQLGRTLGELLADEGRRQALSEQGLAVVQQQRGASARHAELLMTLAGCSGGRS